MEHLTLAVAVVVPLFLLMAVGYTVRRVGWVDAPFLKRLNALNFQTFMPFILFLSIYRSDFAQDFSWKLVGTALAFVVTMFTLAWVIIPRVEKDNLKRGVMIQGIFRSNIVLFGIPVAETVYGFEAVAVMALVISVTVPVLNSLCVVCLEAFCDNRSSRWAVVKNVFKNPFVIASLSGGVFVLLGIEIPPLLLDVMTDLSLIGSPLALVILGGDFYFRRLQKAGWQLGFVIAFRLVVMPVVFIAIAVWMGFRNEELLALFCMVGSPTAVSSYAMAQRIGGDVELAGQIVVASSLCSIVSIFCWIVALGSMGLI